MSEQARRASGPVPRPAPARAAVGALAALAVVAGAGCTTNPDNVRSSRWRATTSATVTPSRTEPAPARTPTRASPGSATPSPTMRSSTPGTVAPSSAAPSDGATAAATLPTAASPGHPASPAADWLARQLTDLAQNVYVYRDFGDGANTYTQKAALGPNTEAATMIEDAAGRDGSTGIEARLDLASSSWGGYLFLPGALTAGSTEPTLDFGATGPGPNLSGASRLTLWAKGATGTERVRFYLGGLGDAERVAHPDSLSERSTGWVRLTSQWRKYTIDLAAANLTSVTAGFGWVANREHNDGQDAIGFYLDDIRYEFPAPRPTPQLLASYAPAKAGTDQAIINGFAYVYDNAVACLALLRAGYPQHAQAIGDALVYAARHDRTFDDGRLRNAYANGDPRSLPTWSSARGGPFARLPGFWDTPQAAWFEDYYADSTSAGNLAWAIIALAALHEEVGGEYLATAEQLAGFVLTLRGPGGGFTGGHEGFDEDQAKVTYLSTEHNLDLVTAFRVLARLTDGPREQEYREAADGALSFVLSMREASTGGFYTGTKPDGRTPNTDVLPLDTNTWAVLALGSRLTDPARTMAFAEATMAVGDGFDFNTDRDGIWNEGTAQAVLAYREIGQRDKADQVLAGLTKRARPDGSIGAADRDGVTTGFTVSGTNQPWLYDNRVHVGATAWLAFAQMDYNPLAAP